MIKSIGKTTIIALMTVIVASGSIHATMTLLNDTDLNRVTGQTGLNIRFLEGPTPKKPADIVAQIDDLTDSESALIQTLCTMLTTEPWMENPVDFNLLAATNDNGQTVIHGFDLHVPVIHIDIDPSGHGRRGHTTLGINDLNIRLRGNVAITVH